MPDLSPVYQIPRPAAIPFRPRGGTAVDFRLPAAGRLGDGRPAGFLLSPGDGARYCARVKHKKHARSNPPREEQTSRGPDTDAPGDAAPAPPTAPPPQSAHPPAPEAGSRKPEAAPPREDKPRANRPGRRNVFWRIVGWVFKTVFITLLLVVLLVAGAFAWLHFKGLPRMATDAILDRLAEAGLHVALDRIVLDFPLGATATNVRAFPSADDPSPFFEAPAVSAALSLRQLAHNPAAPAGTLELSGACLRARPNSPVARRHARATGDELSATGVSLRMAFDNEGIRIRESSAELLGILFRARGTVRFDPNAVSDPDSDPIGEFFALLDNPPESLLTAVENANAVSFEGRPTADLTFHVDLADVESARAAVHFRNPEGGKWKEFAFASTEAFVSFSNRTASVSRLLLAKEGGREASLSGSFGLADSNLLVRAESSLRPADVMPLLPRRLRAQIAEVLPEADFPLRLSFEAGPAPLPEAVNSFRAGVALSGANVAGIAVETFRARMERRGNVFAVTNAYLAVSNGTAATALNIPSASFDLGTMQAVATLRGPLNPSHFMAAMPDYVSEPISWLEFPGPAPVVDVTVTVPVDNPLAASATGFGYATNFLFQGVALDSARARVAFSNETLHLSAIKVARPEGIASGDVYVCFSNSTVRLDVDSSLEAHASFALLGPYVAEFFAPFRFDGPVRAHAEGIVDYSALALNRVQAHIDACRAGYSNWVADTVSADLRVRGRRVSFTNIVASAYGGDVRADVAFFPVGVDENWRFELAVHSVSNLDLGAFFDATLGEHSEEAPRGFLSASGRLAGYILPGDPKATLDSFDGKLDTAIRDGFIFQAGLFAGFSDLVSYVLPGFSLFAQTEATGTFVFGKGRVRTDNLKVLGSVFSVNAEGAYGFDNSLDFVFELKLLRSGAVAYLVRLATLPVTHLLEFRLSGTLDKPSWAPATLSPSAFFDLFRDKAPPEGAASK